MKFSPMSPTPHALERLIQEFTRLPGIGPKTAERLVYYLLKQPKEVLSAFAQSLEQAKFCKINRVIQRCVVDNPNFRPNACLR
ncbi:MAG TPA: helix-hairpin-helix domain-containing protein [Patescibacteria group bacterium]|nr:helix-hairpin-helix domain-containing protein [Patescibacteria group bacterium]